MLSLIRCKGENVSELIVLTSSSAEERIDEQLTGPQFRYLSTKEEETFRFASPLNSLNQHYTRNVIFANLRLPQKIGLDSVGET